MKHQGKPNTPILSARSVERFYHLKRIEVVNKCWQRIEPDSVLASLEMLGFGLPLPERVKVPMLVMGAANDRQIRCAEVEATARAYGTQAVIIPGLAHHMMLDPGWQVVAERMLFWLAEQGL